MENQKREDESKNLVEVRAYRPLVDKPFVYKSWLESYKNSRFAGRIKHSVYFMWHRLLIDHLLDRPATGVAIAHVKDEPEVILGFLAFEMLNAEAKIIHYCFVKEPFRRNGIAKLLCEMAEIKLPAYFTHWTYAIDPIFDKHQNQLTYDPYRA